MPRTKRNPADPGTYAQCGEYRRLTKDMKPEERARIRKVIDGLVATGRLRYYPADVVMGGSRYGQISRDPKLSRIIRDSVE